MAQHTMPRCCRRMIAFGREELTTLQRGERGLHGALRQAGVVGQFAQAPGHRAPILSDGLTIEPDVDEKRRRLLVVSDEIAQQDIEHIVVNGHGAAEARHGSRLPHYR